MLAKDFYAIIKSEESTVEFLKAKGLLPSDETLPRCDNCGAETKLYKKKERGKERVLIRCRRKGCQRTHSIRKKNKFFTYVDGDGRCNSGLSLSQILEIAFLWCQQMTSAAMLTVTGRSSHTICDWMNLCREIPAAMFARRTKMGGRGTIVQVDECLLRGKRKYNRGRLLAADRRAEAIEEEDISEEDLFSARNYGQRMEGPWIFGLCEKTTDGVLDARYFVVERRDRLTLHGIILNEVELGTEIHSDEWLAYKTLDQLGYIHKTVNHSENFIDPLTGANTQRIETLWGPLKLKMVKMMRGTSSDLLPSYLAEQWWRLKNRNEDIFLAFLRDMEIVSIE